MSPTTQSTLKSKSGVRKSVSKASKNTLVARNNKHAAAWWDCEDEENNGDFADVVTKTTRVSSLPNGAGMMNLFESDFGLKMGETRLMSEVDENRKLCLSLTDAQYGFLTSLQEELEKTLVQQVKTQHPKYANAEFFSSVKVSETTGQKYLKTKVQLLGYSRTMGIDVDGASVSNVPEVLNVPGTMLHARLMISGVYVTKERCGLVTKLDMFRVTKVPSDEELGEERDAKRRKLEADREEELMNF
jgi:hypothetical protein